MAVRLVEPHQDRTLSSIRFDPRERRVIDGLSRWMGLLGRLQVLAGGALALTVCGLALAYGATEAFETPPGAFAAPPLVRLGEVSPGALVALGCSGLLVGLLLLRGGVLLTDAAEDLEHLAQGEGGDRPHLEDALRRLRGYWRMELALVLAALAAMLAWAVPGWT